MASGFFLSSSSERVLSPVSQTSRAGLWGPGKGSRQTWAWQHLLSPPSSVTQLPPSSRNGNGRSGVSGDGANIKDRQMVLRFTTSNQFPADIIKRLGGAVLQMWSPDEDVLINIVEKRRTEAKFCITSHGHQLWEKCLLAPERLWTWI